MARTSTRLWNLTRFLRRSRLVEDLGVGIIYTAVKILSALPSRWVLRLGDAMGIVLTWIDRRGRRVAFQNMRVAFGDGKSRAEQRRIFRASYQGVLRSMLVLLHVQPLTAEKYQKWVSIDDVADHPITQKIRERGAVFVSGHIGNWELLLGLRLLFQHFPPSVFLAEAVPHHAINRVMEKLRAHGDLTSALRKGGARALTRVLDKGGTVGILVDRNLRGRLGGVWAPFLGLRARTSPLPAWLATRYGVPLHPIFCLPTEDGRYRLWLGPDVTENLSGTTEFETTREILGRLHDILEDIIRAQPELWNWTLKRFKSRPNQTLDDYPPYSEWDGDHTPPRR